MLSIRCGQKFIQPASRKLVVCWNSSENTWISGWVWSFRFWPEDKNSLATIRGAHGQNCLFWVAVWF
jgi:hypothetical protein